MDNTTVEPEEDDESLAVHVLVLYGMFIVMCIFFGLVGNVMTIIAYIRDEQLHTVYNTYLLNLAITDFLLSIVSMPFYAVYTLSTYTWYFGYHFCKIYMVIDFTLCLESVIIVTIISVDRLLLLKFGPHYPVKMTMKNAFIQIGVSWLISFLFYSPAIIGWDIWTGENIVEDKDCDVQFAYDTKFTTTTALIEFGIPFLCIGIVNCIIYQEIRKRKSVGISKNQQSTEGNRKSKSDMKAVKFLAALVLVFFVTWLPYTVTTIFISFCDDCVGDNLYQFFNWLLWSKAALNPFLYAYNSTRFKKNFEDLLPFLKNENVSRERAAQSETLQTVS